MISHVLHSTDFAGDAARFILDCGRKAIAERGLFRLGLTGGRSPKVINPVLIARAGDLPWSKVQLTFGDERCVPPDHADSNYREAKESLLDPSGIPEGNVFRIRGEIAPADAAAEYDARLAQVASRFGEPRYQHDLLLLGMGPDGHTASLFPGTEALAEQTRNVVSNFVPKLNAWRVTFTYPLLNAARHVCFLLEGPDKKPIVDQILAGQGNYPSEGVKPTDGQLTWLLGT